MYEKLNNEIISQRSGIPLNIVKELEASQRKEDRKSYSALQIGFVLAFEGGLTPLTAFDMAKRIEELEDALIEVGVKLECMRK